MGVLRTIYRRLVAECVASCTGSAATGPTASASADASASRPSTACGLLPATGTDGYLSAAPDGRLLSRSGLSGAGDRRSGLSCVGCPGNGRDQCGFKDHLVGSDRL